LYHGGGTSIMRKMRKWKLVEDEGRDCESS
jgi:hypothetical protein